MLFSLASVQEQRLPVISNVEVEETPTVASTTVQHSKVINTKTFT